MIWLLATLAAAAAAVGTAAAGSVRRLAAGSRGSSGRLVCRRGRRRVCRPRCLRGSHLGGFPPAAVSSHHRVGRSGGGRPPPTPEGIRQGRQLGREVAPKRLPQPGGHARPARHLLQLGSQAARKKTRAPPRPPLPVTGRGGAWR